MTHAARPVRAARRRRASSTALDRLRDEAEARGVDMATLAFAWVLAHPRVAGAVCGPNRAEQLDPVLAARELCSCQPDDSRPHREVLRA